MGSSWRAPLLTLRVRVLLHSTVTLLHYHACAVAAAPLHCCCRVSLRKRVVRRGSHHHQHHPYTWLTCDMSDLTTATHHLYAVTHPVACDCCCSVIMHLGLTCTLMPLSPRAKIDCAQQYIIAGHAHLYAHAGLVVCCCVGETKYVPQSHRLSTCDRPALSTATQRPHIHHTLLHSAAAAVSECITGSLARSCQPSEPPAAAQ
jgi:hypothetical protein